MIKAVFIDIDGTLVDTNRKISDYTVEQIKKCIEKGIIIVLSSGRSRLQTFEFSKLAGTSPYIISSNGADVYDLKEDKEIYSTSISKNVINDLFDYSIENDYKIAFNYDFELNINKMFYPDEIDRVKDIDYLKKIVKSKKIVQCVVSNKDIEKMKEFKKYLLDKDFNLKIENESKRLIDESLPPSKHYYCDLISKNASKGKAVKKVCEYLKLDYDDIVAIGDGVNDITMFNLTKNSVAMGNASDKVKEKAKFITDSNNEEGVAKILNKILKNELI